MKIIKQAVSGFVVQSNDSKGVAVDFGRDVPDHIVDNHEVAAVICSHVHPDHHHIPHALRFGTKVYAAEESALEYQAAGIDAEALRSGSSFSVAGLEFEAFEVDHGEISAPIVNLGFTIRGDGVRIWYAGDIAEDTCPRPNGKFDLVLLPVGGGKVFDAKGASDYLTTINHEGAVVPIHFDTAPLELAEFLALSEGRQFSVEVLGHSGAIEVAQ